MREPKRILVIRLSALGDVLLATPAVRALAARFPSARIDWLVEAPYLPLLEANPHARPIALDKRGRHAGAAGLQRLRCELAREGGYDLVVDLQSKPRTWVLRGVGRDCLAFHKRTPLQGLLALLGRDPPLVRAHAIDLFLEALAPLEVEPAGRALELRVTDAMREEAAPLLAGAGPLVGIAPGTRWDTKRWPAERFAALAAELRGRGLQPVLIGGPGDRAAIDAVRAALPDDAGVPDTTALSVGGLVGLIDGLRLLVAGDSGPVHIASALGTPVVAVFGPTAPERWRPLSRGAEVVRLPVSCSPCSNHGGDACPEGHHQCMRLLEVGAVLAAALRVLEAGRAADATG